MNSPSVNWSVLNKLNTKLDYQDPPETLTIGSCELHIVYGALEVAFKK